MLETLASWATSVSALVGIVIAFPIRGKNSTGGAATSLRPRRQQRAVETPLQMPARALTPAEHFKRVSQVVSRAIRSTNLASDMQEQARIQLEVVEISIDRILEELAEVMALTPEMQRRCKPALVAVPVAIRQRAA